MKIRPYFILFGAIITLIFHLKITHYIKIAGVFPDLMFFWVIISSFYLPLKKSVITNWFIGILVDLVSATGFGVFGFLYLSVGLFISFLRTMFFSEDIITRIGTTFISAFVCYFICGLFFHVLQRSLGFWFVFFKALTIALYTSIVAVIFFMVLDIIQRLILSNKIRKELKG